MNDDGLDQLPVRRAEELSEHSLLRAVRARHPDAIEEFIRRYHIMVISEARRLGVQRAECASWAIELLYHVAMALARGRASMPRAIGPYLATACKRRMLSEQRQQLVRERHEIERADETGAIGERAVLGLCSEDAVRSSFGPDWEAPPLSPTLERLASALDEGVSLQERQILSWLEERVSFSEIAGELGISRSAAIKRVARLRERLVDAAYRLGESMDRTDLSELVRFFRRSRFADEARLAIMVNRIAARSSRDSEL